MATTTLPATRSAAPAPATVAAGPAVEVVVRRWGALPLAAVIGAGGQIVLFAALAGAYLAFRHVTSPWPSEGIALDGYIGNVVALTAVMQAFTVQWAVRSARIDDQRDVNIALALAIALGAAMANAVWYAMSIAGFGPGDSAYGLLYFALHGAYLASAIIGLGVLVVTLARSLGGQFGPDRAEGVRACAIHWHGQVISWLIVWAIVWVLK